MVCFAKVYEHKVSGKNLISKIKKQLSSVDKSIFPYDSRTGPVLRDFFVRDFANRGYEFFCGSAKVYVDTIDVGKPKIELVPYDVHTTDLEVRVRDLHFGNEYRAKRIHKEFGGFDDPLSYIYSCSDPLAVIAQVASFIGSATTLGVSYVGADVLEPKISDIMGDPVFIPKWVVPLDLMMVYTVFPGCTYPEEGDAFNLKVKGGVVCDGIIGRVLYGQIVDIKKCLDDWTLMEDFM